MTDASTGKSLLVSTDGDAGPYIMVPVSQVKQLQQILDTNDIKYWVDEDAVSLDGQPEITVVNLSRDCDVPTVQTILDRA